MKSLIYYHTLKYLKFSQIYYRVIKHFIRPSPNEMIGDLAVKKRAWIPHDLYDSKFLGGNQVRFLNKERELANSNCWNDSRYEKLWLYNLHYFDDLSAFDTASRTSLQVQLISRWVTENPAPLGNGWEPYPTSLRIVNWIKGFLSYIEPNQSFLNSLAKQADYLSQNLEKHILANHLFANAKALIFSGLFLKGENAKKWLSIGLKIYQKELKEQVLSDGGNFELTPMYHVIMLVDLLDLINIFNVYPERIEHQCILDTEVTVLKMLNWLEAMSHQDGEISFFNDSTFGIAATNPIVFEYAQKLGINFSKKENVSAGTLIVKDLSKSGYVSIKSDAFSLIADLAEIGPSYQPGHAHADTLSFEMAIFGMRVFVNSGISEYGINEERLRQRKTAAHNTVAVNGLDSSQVWSGFRVAKRANVVERFVKMDDSKKVTFLGSHNGYKKQGLNCIHRRKWEVNSDSITISDTLLGEFNDTYSYLHLHPECRVTECSDKIVRLSRNNCTILLEIVGAKVLIEDSTWHPEFGVTVANKRLSLHFIKSSVRMVISWIKSN